MSNDSLKELNRGLRRHWAKAKSKHIESIITNAVEYFIPETYVCDFDHMPNGELEDADDAELVHFDVNTFKGKEEIKELMTIVATRLQAIFGATVTYAIYIHSERHTDTTR